FRGGGPFQVQIPQIPGNEFAGTIDQVGEGVEGFAPGDEVLGFQVWSSGPTFLELQALIGWSGWSTGPQNTDDRLRLNRIPLELLSVYGYRVPQSDMVLRLGGGSTYYLLNKVRGTGSLKGYTTDFDNSLGFTGEVSAIFASLSVG